MYESLRFLGDRGAEIEVMSPREARKRFPFFDIRDEETYLFDPWAGYIESGLAVCYMANMAKQLGVQVIEGTYVTGIEDGKDVRIALERDAVSFDRVVVAVGAWVGGLVTEIGKRLRITRQ